MNRIRDWLTLKPVERLGHISLQGLQGASELRKYPTVSKRVHILISRLDTRSAREAFGSEERDIVED